MRRNGENIMGYCSDIALIMKKCVWHEMREHFADNIDVLNTLDRAKVIAYRDEYTILSWTFLKCLEPIDTIRNYLDEAEHDYHYARVGDEIDDTEENMAGEDDVMNDAFYIPHAIYFENEAADLLRTASAE
jgi:hypothetical protein